MIKLNFITPLALLFLAGTLCSQANLLVYEPFNYAPVNDEVAGRLEGKNGGTGWGAAWADSGDPGYAFVYDSRGNASDLYDGIYPTGSNDPTWDGVIDNLPQTGNYVGLSSWSSQISAQTRLNSYRRLAQSAGAMAANNGGILWLSVGVHFANNNFFITPTVMLTTQDSYLQERGKTLSGSGAGLGTALGSDFNNVNLTKDLNPLFMAGGVQTVKTTGVDISPASRPDLTLILKFEFGASSDTVRVWYFGEGDTMSEATFNTNAIASTSSIDESTLNTLTFAIDQQLNAIGEIRIGETFSDIIGIPSALIQSFGIPGSAGIIDQTAKSIALSVPFGTNLATLAPTFTLTTGTCNPSSGSVPSPTFAAANPATYTVTDGDTVNNYAVTVTVASASAACDMQACNFGALGPATISGTNVVLTVPPSQPITSLSPTFTLSPNATINPTSGSAQNFTSPVIYRVTAENGTTFKDYTISVQSYEAWAHSGSFFILTTPNGADIPGGTIATDFPLLLRLKTGNFNFAEAQSDGRDIRFTTPAGLSLPYQVDEWDAVAGSASIWVKIPSITGNASQEIKMYWGKTGVTSESDASEVFNASNGYASVIHMGTTLADAVGTVTPSDTGTTLTAGISGKARNFTAGKGINCGTNITGLPSGSGPFSTGVWIRSLSSPSTVLGWGVDEPSQKKVVMQMLSPPHIKMECWFGGGDVTGSASVPLSAWNYVVHTFQTNAAKLYINGVLDASASSNSGTMNIPASTKWYLGGWNNSYSFVGDLDEVRISNVVRSAAWVKLEYENQKPLQTLVGTLVRPGSTFSAAPAAVTINEGTGTTLAAQADGAQKFYWIYKKDGQETVLATDQLSLNIPAVRTTGNLDYVIQFKAVYPGSVQTVDIPVTITEAIPDPVFTLTAPATWNGRDTITVTSNIANLAAMQAAGAGNLNYQWSVNGVAVIKQITPGVLTLLRSQGSGPMTVSLTADNGGSPITVSKTIIVHQPASDAWQERTPGATEKPVNNQFFARNPNTNLGTVYYNGTQSGSPNTVYLKVYKTPSGGSETLDATYRQALVGGAYTFSAPIAAGLITYRVVYGTTTGGTDTDVATVTNLVCGDAFIIEGQSNALATDNTEPSAPAPSSWIRTYGKTLGWGNAVNKSSLSELQLGVWGMMLAQRLVANNAMPICMINGAVGGTRIDQHMPNPANHALANGSDSIYANLYNRVTGAKLSHGIRSVLWHQGENDQGADGPDGGYDYKFYQQYFVDMTAAWKQDFPNIQNYYVFQIWPAACGDTSRNDQLREVQRTLPNLYSNMRMMSTVGIVPGSSCHYVAAGYQKFSDLIGPLIEQDAYGLFPSSVFTAANLENAYFTTATKNEIALEFDQNMAWNSGALGLLFLDGVAGKVTSGSATGKVLKLQLNTPSTAATITYLKGLVSWNQANILYGNNGIAALTFADVAIAPSPSPYSQWSSDPAQGLTAGANDGPLDDPDNDGISNLLEFVLGGAPMVSSLAILPELTKDGATWVFEYDRNDLALPPATTQVVEYGNDLTGWTPLTIPTTSAGSVTVTPGSPSDHIRVALPDLGSTGFVRLKVSP